MEGCLVCKGHMSEPGRSDNRLPMGSSPLGEADRGGSTGVFSVAHRSQPQSSLGLLPSLFQIFC